MNREETVTWIAKKNRLETKRIHRDELILVVTPEKLGDLELPDNCKINGNQIISQHGVIRIAKKVFRFKNGKLTKQLKVYNR